jgi:hypothetical protein
MLSAANVGRVKALPVVAKKPIPTGTKIDKKGIRDFIVNQPTYSKEIQWSVKFDLTGS